MKKNFFLSILFICFVSCSSNREMIYLKDSNTQDLHKVNYSALQHKIENGDILKIDVQTSIPEVSQPYNNFSRSGPLSSNELLMLEGYLVQNRMIKYPILGEISVDGLNENQLASKISKLLIDGGHLTSPYIKVRRVNSKFTVLGEVRNPGTFSYYDKNINIFQALGYAGDLNVDGKRNNIKLIREQNGLRKIYKFSLNSSDLLLMPFYNIQNNDVIIVDPNFSKVKSAGFIGSPSSIASISSILLSITLLLINN